MVNSKRKGKVGELDAVKAIMDHLCIPVRRSVQYKGTAESADLDVLGGYPIHFEVKRVESLSVYAALERALQDAGRTGDNAKDRTRQSSTDNNPCPKESKPVLLLWRRNRKPWLAICLLADLPEIANIVSTAKQNTIPYRQHSQTKYHPPNHSGTNCGIESSTK
mgnify:CR=1 FL=1